MAGIVDNKEKELSAAATTTTTTTVTNDTLQVETSSIVTSTITTVEPPMGVLPLNSSTKLDQEPNPFEESFSGEAITVNKLKLPPVASITSPAVTKATISTNNNNNNIVIGGGILPKEVSNQFTWDTLRTGPLSPSMLQGPANPDDYYQKPQYPGGSGVSHRSSFSTTAATAPHMHQQPMASIKVEQQQHQFIPSKRQRSISQHTEDNDHLSMGSSNESIDASVNKRRTSRRRRSSNLMDSEDEEQKKKSRSSKEPEEVEKRRNFLERNRIAALKCRQRKKQWLNNLQTKVEFLTSDNERLQVQSESLKEEIVNLKTLLLAHKECPVAQSNGFHANAIQKAMPNTLLMMQQQQQNNNRMPPSSSTATPTTPASISSFRSNSSIQTASTSTTFIPRYPRHHPHPHEQQLTNTGGSSSSVLRF